MHKDTSPHEEGKETETVNAEPADDEFREDHVPVHGDQEKADELAEKAYGDTDDDGDPDVPHVQFPG